MTESITPEQLAASISSILDEHKAIDIQTINVKPITSIADYMIIASGSSARHGNALTDYVVTTLKAQGVQPLGSEGRDECEWILLDYGDVLVHIMQQETREFYQLEKLWHIPETDAVSNN